MYRIKIQEHNNGDKWYIPQFGERKLIFKSWENILVDKHSRVQTSSSTEYLYRTEEEAIEYIEKHKEFILKEEEEKVKSIRYKTIN